MSVATKENVFSLKGASDRVYYVGADRMMKKGVQSTAPDYKLDIANYKLHTFITNSPTEPMTEVPQNLQYEFPLLKDDAMDVLVDYLKTGYMTALWCKNEPGTTKVVDLAAALMKTDPELYYPFMNVIRNMICPSRAPYILSVAGNASCEIRLICIDLIVKEMALMAEGRVLTRVLTAAWNV